ncbi:MAG: hypothetical protein HC896_01350 [Bacteroidales bacterium]|nr:hypothetical protein [Bacteroidales bacterium]
MESIALSHDTVPEWMPHTNGRNMVDPKTGKRSVHRNQYDGSASTCNNSIAVSRTLSAAQDTIEHTFGFAWNFRILWGREF